MDGERKDVWASGDAYEPYVGRWSRLVAREFVPWLRVPSNSEWLDIGCGTGAGKTSTLKNAHIQPAIIDARGRLLRAAMEREGFGLRFSATFN